MTRSHLNPLPGIEMQSEQIVDLIESALCTPPSTVGARLRPELELAELFDVGLHDIRLILKSLVDRGILVRKRGSGTYIRKMPSSRTGVHVTNSFKLSSRDLLVGQDVGTPQNLIRKSDRFTESSSALHLGVWSDLNEMKHPSQDILLGMAQAAEERGHYLTVHLCSMRDSQNGNEYLRTRLQSQVCDGYIINKHLHDMITSVGNTDIDPIVWYQPSTTSVDCEPLVMFNTAEAVDRAVRQFVELGLTRIALLRQWDPDSKAVMGDYDQDAYESTIRRMGLDYHACEKALIFDRQQVQNACYKLLDREDRPQAVYLDDDHMLGTLCDVMSQLGLEPGRDVAIITLCNKGIALPGRWKWSCMSFDLAQFGRTIVEALLAKLENPACTASVQSIHARWAPGQTHNLSQACDKKYSNSQLSKFNK